MEIGDNSIVYAGVKIYYNCVVGKECIIHAGAVIGADGFGFEPDKEIKIVYSGLRPGEKLYEEVLSDKENTDPTSHDRIRVARVRNYSHEDACQFTDELEILSRQVQIPEMVKLMKEIVPEFKSKNSKFEIYDKA